MIWVLNAHSFLIGNERCTNFNQGVLICIVGFAVYLCMNSLAYSHFPCKSKDGLVLKKDKVSERHRWFGSPVYSQNRFW